jgi:HSP20 family protein
MKPEKTAAPFRSPAVDVLEREDGWRIELDLPGASADDVTVDVEQGVLRVEASAERAAPEGLERLGRTRLAPSTAWRREFRLPEEADQDSLRARLLDGVLAIELDRGRETRRTIPIQGA